MVKKTLSKGQVLHRDSLPWQRLSEGNKRVSLNESMASVSFLADSEMQFGTDLDSSGMQEHESVLQQLENLRSE